MNIKDFAEKMKSAIADTLKKEVRSIEPLKPNGIRLCGITVVEPDSNTSCTIYLEPFFERFLNTGDWARTVSDVLSFYEHYRVTDSFDMERFRDFSQIKKNLFYRLINYEANQELLSMIPHTRFLDLAKIYYAGCQIGKSTSGSILIHHDHVAEWGIREEELITAAEENTPRLYPVKLHSLSDALGQEDEIDAPPGTSVPMFVLSNTEGQNGAAAICYKDVLESFSEKIEDDLVILPSSLHETMLIPFHAGSSIESLKATVYDINRTILDWSDFLSDNVYIYSRQNKGLMIA